MNARPEPFALNVPDTAIADLRERLARTRLPDQAPGEPWAYGTSVEYMRGLAEYLAHKVRLARAGRPIECISSVQDRTA